MRRVLSAALAAAVLTTVLAVATPASATTCWAEEIGGGTGGRGVCTGASFSYRVSVPCWDGQNIGTRYTVLGDLASGGVWSYGWCAAGDWRSSSPLSVVF
jgi:hypothetical protein